MAGSFDPYHKWLGISPKDQPPNHYRLLGIELFEADPDVIESAADQRMAHVRTFQAGQNSADSQRLLNELSAAKLCLLDPQKKPGYDDHLRGKLKQASASSVGAEPVIVAPAAQSLPQAASRPADVAPIIVSGGDSVRASQRLRRKRPVWQQPAVLGTIGAASVLAAVVFIVAMKRPPRGITGVKASRTTTVAKSDEPRARTKRQNGASVPLADAPKQAASDVIGDPSKSAPMPQADADGASQRLSLVADASRPRETPGVIADRVVIWNQHNNDAKDRGTRECNLSLWRDGREVWRQDSIETPWSPDADKNVSVTLPQVRFDRIRVEVTNWERHGGGLAEIEVVRGDRNLALGCPAVASFSYDERFPAIRLTDGMHASSTDAFWLLPDSLPGWAEVDLAFAEPRPSAGVSAEKLVVWNTHNAQANDRGALALNVQLSLGGDEVWRQDDVPVAWQAGSNERVEIALPDKRFDRVRIEVHRWQGRGAGLSEVQVISGGVNLARGCPAIASGFYDSAYVPSKVVDDAIRSGATRSGYWFWLGRNNEAEWIEMDLSCNCPEVGPVNRELGQYLALVEKDWSRGLPWLARGDSIELRALAADDSRLDARVFLDGSQAADAVNVGDGWWDLAQSSPMPAKRELLLRALYRYAAAMKFVPEGDRVRLDERISQFLPVGGGTWLYLLPESDVAQLWPDGNLRRTAIFGGARHPWGLWMTPNSNESATAAFTLAKKYHRFTGAAAISDTSRGLAATPLTFKVLGDERELWASRPLQQKGDSESFDISVANIDRLRLVVECRGSHNWCHALWIDPVLDSSSPASAIARQDDRDRPTDPPIDGGTTGTVILRDARLAVPDDGAQKTARAELQKQFSAKISAAKSPDAKRALAAELIQKAAATTTPDAGMYVTLNQAVDLAEAAGDLDLAWQAVDKLAVAFDVDSPTRRQQSLTEVGKAARSPQQYRDLAEAACLLIADALAAEDAALVKRVAAQAQSFAKRAKDAALTKTVAARARDAGKLAAQLDAVSQARDTLKTASDDANANFTAGHYELCAAGDREHALPKLAKAADADWKKLASGDLNASRNDVAPQQQLALADAWLARAEDESWPGRHYLHMRAGEWYRRALPSLAGIERTQCVNRLKKLLAEDEGLPAWELFELNRAEKRGTYLRIEPGGRLRTCVEYDGPMDITFVARTDSLNIRLAAYGTEAVIWNWEVNPRELRVRGHDGSTVPFPVTPLQENRWYALRYRVTTQGTSITADGVPVFTEPKAYQNFPRSSLGVNGAGPAVIDVKKFIVSPVE